MIQQIDNHETSSYTDAKDNEITVGDVVQVLEDYETVQSLQRRCSYWTDELSQFVLNEVAIIRSFATDDDVLLDFSFLTAPVEKF